MTPQAALFADACALCGAEGTPTRRELVEWLEPVDRGPGLSPETWCLVPRCVDRVACRSRVETELREAWPVNDRTPAPTRPVEVAAPAEPQEVSPWLR